MKIMLVCSSGGHFTSMMRLERFWRNHEHIWVTFRSPQTVGSLAHQRVQWAYSPTNRNLVNLLRNLFLAFTVLFAEKPDLILSTGAGVAVPFLLVGKLTGCRVVFIESLTRTHTLSLSARLVMPFAEIYVQWPQLQKRHPKTIYAGVNTP